MPKHPHPGSALHALIIHIPAMILIGCNLLHFPFLSQVKKFEMILRYMRHSTKR